MTIDKRPTSSPLAWVFAMAAWGALVLFGMGFLAVAFEETFIYAEPGALVEAHVHVLMGCMILVLASVVDWWLSAPLWTWLLVGAPALVLGVVALDSPLDPPNAGILITLPIVLVGFVASLVLARPLRRFSRWTRG